MFFTPELLAKRDNGFGLLWCAPSRLPLSHSHPLDRLAATLGSRSNFKKLPKRSVLTADIGQLCDLISEPAEPLALRLSSNLMFGVVRYAINSLCNLSVSINPLFRVYKGLCFDSSTSSPLMVSS
jgi:meiotic recombination protein REC8